MVDIWKVVRLEVERPGPRHLSLKFVALQSHSKGPNDNLPHPEVVQYGDEADTSSGAGGYIQLSQHLDVRVD